MVPMLAMALDYSAFDLTPKQLELLDKLEARGFTEAQLLKAAAVFEKENHKKPTYIPPHTFQDLVALSDWAQGGAFSSFASFAGVEFLADSYKADCPDWALFNFTRATGTEYISYDVLAKTYSLASGLQIKYSRDRENFREFFLQVAKERGFLKYINVNP